MAGQADKKRAKEAADRLALCKKCAAVALALHVLLRSGLCWGHSSRLPRWYELLLLLLTAAAAAAAASWQQQLLLVGVSSSSSSTDLLLLAFAAAVLGGLHPYGWFIWTLVPFYFIFLFFKLLLKWIFSEELPNPQDLALQKKQNKLQRKLKSGRYAVMQ